MDKNTIKMVNERQNPIIESREYQNYINKLGWKGGKPYVEERLSRFAAEGDIDWNGGTRKDGSTVTGRKERAYVVPYLERIVDKINQYVFGELPTRTNIEAQIAEDITSQGKSIDDLMAEVSAYLTIHGWCWIGVDAPLLPIDAQISQSDKNALKIRPYAQVYDANSVVDWYFSPSGELEWLITESIETLNSSPFMEAQSYKVRRLWERGRVTKITTQDDKVISVEEFEISLKTEIPFVLVGTPSSDPFVFDNLEAINRTIMDLSSSNLANYTNCVYPQLTLPASVIDTVMNTYSVNAETATTMVKGYSYPILLNEGDAEPKYLMPDASAIGTIRLELDALKKELMESVGLILKSESSMAESAEAKAFDNLDLDMLVRARAQKLEKAEQSMARMINEWDSSIPVYEVEYNKTVRSEDLAEDLKDDVKESILSK